MLMIKQNDSDLIQDYLNKQTSKETSKKALWIEKWEKLKEVENTSKIFNLIELCLLLQWSHYKSDCKHLIHLLWENSPLQLSLFCTWIRCLQSDL